MGLDEEFPAQGRCTAIARSAGYTASQKLRKRIEESFGWAQPIGGMTLAAYNLVRLHKRVAT